MKCLAILGASGHGKVVAEAALLGGWEQIVFYDDAWPQKSRIGIWTIAGDTQSLLREAGQVGGVVVAIGDNSVRLNKIRMLQDAGLKLPAIVHPAAVVSDSARLGMGCVVMAGAIVNADAEIGLGAILNTACSVDHDCVLGDAAHVSPGAHLAGDVRVGNCAWIGIGASVRQGVRIGVGVTVGAGAAVVSDVVDGLTVVGIPARPVPRSAG